MPGQEEGREDPDSEMGFLADPNKADPKIREVRHMPESATVPVPKILPSGPLR